MWRDAGGATLYNETFEYDAVGNRVKQIKNGVTTASVYNSANQIRRSKTNGVTTKYFYDANGNNVRVAKPGEVKKMKYDELNRMVEWKKTGSGQPTMERSTYRGAEWHRHSQTANGVTTKFLYDGDNVVADVVAGNIETAYVSPFLDQNLSMTKNGNTYYYSQDGLGSVRTLTDAAGTIKNNYDYTAYGESFAAGTSETIVNRYQYTGREKNAVSGLQFNRYRNYNSSTGSWLSRDPIYYDDGPGLYSYVGSSPTQWIDPSGLARTSVDAALEACLKLPTAKLRYECLRCLLETLEETVGASQKIKIIVATAKRAADAEKAAKVAAAAAAAEKARREMKERRRERQRERRSRRAKRRQAEKELAERQARAKKKREKVTEENASERFAEENDGRKPSRNELNNFKQKHGVSTKTNTARKAKTQKRRRDNAGGGATHTDNARGSSRETHENGQARRNADIERSKRKKY